MVTESFFLFLRTISNISGRHQTYFHPPAFLQTDVTAFQTQRVLGISGQKMAPSNSLVQQLLWKKLTAETNLVGFQMTSRLPPFENLRSRFISISVDPGICIYSDLQVVQEKSRKISKIMHMGSKIDQSSWHHVIYRIYYSKQLCVLLDSLGYNVYLFAELS